MLTEKWQRTLAALCIAQTISMMAFSFVFPFFPLYIQTLGVRGTAEAAQWAGAIIAATAVSMTIAQPIWGNLADRWGRRPMLLRSMLGGAVTLGLMGMVASVEQLLVLRFIQGAVTGTAAAGNALAAAAVPKRRLGFALGMMQVAFFTGASIGPLVGGVIADGLGFRAPFYVSSVLMVIGFVIVLLFVQESFTRPASGAPRKGLMASSRLLMAISGFSVLIGVLFLIQLGGVVVAPVLTLFIVELNGAEGAGTAAGLVLAGTGVASAISALFFGRMGDRIGHRRILPICLAGAGLTYFPQAVVDQVWQLLLLRALLGCFLGGLMPSANALIAQTVPDESRGAAFGLSAASSASANAVGPMAGAFIATHLGIRSIFVVTGALFAIGYAWVTVGFRRAPAPVRPTYRRAPAPERRD